MTKNFLFLAAPFVFLNLCSCATYKVTPESEQLVWINGKAFQDAGNEVIQVKGAYDHKANDHLLFKVEVKNKSEKPVVISPGLFRILTTEKVVAPLNPETLLEQVNSSIALNESAAHGSTGDAVIGLLGTVQAVSGSETEAERTERHRQESESRDRKSLAVQQALLDRQRKAELESDFLRTNTIKAGETAQGLLQFRLPLEPGPLTLVYQTEKGPVNLKFKVKEL